MAIARVFKSGNSHTKVYTLASGSCFVRDAGTLWELIALKLFLCDQVGLVLRLRIERAKEMLRAPEARVLDVAVACGFKTQQHFARTFRRISGASPTEYRQEFLADPASVGNL